MTEIKITAKQNGTWNSMGGNFWIFVSQETIKENGKEVPKWEIMVGISHPRLPEDKIGEFEDLWPTIGGETYPYEISFVDSKQLERNNNERYRFFYDKDKDITIKDNSYSEKIKELRNQTNLMSEEKQQWRGWVKSFRQVLAQEQDKNSVKYKEGRKFIEELEAELNKKTGKGNDDDNRERERERAKLPNSASELLN